MQTKILGFLLILFIILLILHYFITDKPKIPVEPNTPDLIVKPIPHTDPIVKPVKPVKPPAIKPVNSPVVKPDIKPIGGDNPVSNEVVVAPIVDDTPGGNSRPYNKPETNPEAVKYGIPWDRFNKCANECQTKYPLSWQYRRGLCSKCLNNCIIHIGNTLGKYEDRVPQRDDGYGFCDCPNWSLWSTNRECNYSKWG